MTMPASNTVSPSVKQRARPLIPPPMLAESRGVRRATAQTGFALAHGIVVFPSRFELAEGEFLITGRLQNQGRLSPAVAQFIRLHGNGKVTLYGRVENLAPGRDIRMVCHCDDWQLWLRKLLQGADPAALFDNTQRVNEVPPEMARRLIR
jgi:hypothetical protein